MKRFNPEKELNKVQYGDRNKLIGIIVFLLVIIAVGSTYALYQVRHTNKLVFNTVGEFKKRDIYLSVLVDGEYKNDFPTQEEGYVYEGLICDKDGTSATFDKESWELVLRTNKPNKCTVVFGTKPNEPELYQGLIPITIDDDGTIKVADTDSEWYNYAEHKWANAVLVTTEKYNELTQDNQLRKDKAGTILNLDTDILQMYVWIPRYKYQLFNVEANVINPQMINIEFEKGTDSSGGVICKYTKDGSNINESCTKEDGTTAANGDWYTHPAFTFKGTLEESGTELTGIWVGKFESSGINNNNIITNLKIVPNVSSLRNVALAYMFQGVRDIEEKYSANYNINPDKIDTHMMKNIEWGAIAYLTQSKYGRFKNDGKEIADGAEVWINNDKNYTTGCAGSSISAESTICTDAFRWTQGGVHASTSNNVNGVYDMSGGAYEYTMGNMVNESGTFSSGSANFAASSGIIIPNPTVKYYDIYTYATSDEEITRGHLGDASKENRSWYNDITGYPFSSEPWTLRGGYYDRGINAGVWYSTRYTGGANGGEGFRIVLTAQDVNE